MPKSLPDIIIEKQDNLRGKRFIVNRSYKQNSVNLRHFKYFHIQIKENSS